MSDELSVLIASLILTTLMYLANKSPRFRAWWDGDK